MHARSKLNTFFFKKEKNGYRNFFFVFFSFFFLFDAKECVGLSELRKISNCLCPQNDQVESSRAFVFITDHEICFSLLFLTFRETQRKRIIDFFLFLLIRLYFFV